MPLGRMLKAQRAFALRGALGIGAAIVLQLGHGELAGLIGPPGFRLLHTQLDEARPTEGAAGQQLMSVLAMTVTRRWPRRPSAAFASHVRNPPRVAHGTRR